MPNESDKTYIINTEHTETISKEQYQGDLKEFLYDLLRVQGPLTRGQLVELTGVARTTLYDTLDKLMLQGKVEKYQLKEAKKGRPTVFYEIKR